MKDFQKISSDAFYKMEHYHQISIDLIQETEELFSRLQKVKNTETKNELITDLNCKYYDIDVILEVFNPINEFEISDLKDVLIHIENKIKEVELITFENER